jgi:hypothetical protein
MISIKTCKCNPPTIDVKYKVAGGSDIAVVEPRPHKLPYDQGHYYMSSVTVWPLIVHA